MILSPDWYLSHLGSLKTQIPESWPRATESEFLGRRRGDLNVDSGLGSDPGSTGHYLCDLKQVT